MDHCLEGQGLASLAVVDMVCPHIPKEEKDGEAGKHGCCHNHWCGDAHLHTSLNCKGLYRAWTRAQVVDVATCDLAYVLGAIRLVADGRHLGVEHNVWQLIDGVNVEINIDPAVRV